MGRAGNFHVHAVGGESAHVFWSWAGLSTIGRLRLWPPAPPRPCTSHPLIPTRCKPYTPQVLSSTAVCVPLAPHCHALLTPCTSHKLADVWFTVLGCTAGVQTSEDHAPLTPCRELQLSGPAPSTRCTPHPLRLTALPLPPFTSLPRRLPSPAPSRIPRPAPRPASPKPSLNPHALQSPTLRPSGSGTVPLSACLLRGTGVQRGGGGPGGAGGAAGPKVPGDLGV